MQDGYGDSRERNSNKANEMVAGTTGIGLKKVVSLPGGGEQFENVLSPKVVLVSTLKEALHPPPPSSRSNKKGRGRAEGEQDGRERLSPSKGYIDS